MDRNKDRDRDTDRNSHKDKEGIGTDMDTDKNRDRDRDGDMDRDGERDEDRDRTGIQGHFSGISDLQTTFELEYLREFEIKLENNLGYESGVLVELIHEKNKPNISCYCPFKILSIVKNTWG
jgi:hypothetical protein